MTAPLPMVVAQMYYYASAGDKQLGAGQCYLFILRDDAGSFSSAWARRRAVRRRMPTAP